MNQAFLVYNYTEMRSPLGCMIKRWKIPIIEAFCVRWLPNMQMVYQQGFFIIKHTIAMHRNYFRH